MMKLLFLIALLITISKIANSITSSSGIELDLLPNDGILEFKNKYGFSIENQRGDAYRLESKKGKCLRVGNGDLRFTSCDDNRSEQSWYVDIINQSNGTITFVLKNYLSKWIHPSRIVYLGGDGRNSFIKTKDKNQATQFEVSTKIMNKENNQILKTFYCKEKKSEFIVHRILKIKSYYGCSSLSTEVTKSDYLEYEAYYKSVYDDNNKVTKTETNDKKIANNVIKTKNEKFAKNYCQNINGSVYISVDKVCKSPNKVISRATFEKHKLFHDKLFQLPKCNIVGTSVFGLFACYGEITFADGNKYNGNFFDNKFNGQGTYTFYNGDKYVGFFLNNQMHGEGTYTFANGKILNGKWKFDKLVEEYDTTEVVQLEKSKSSNNTSSSIDADGYSNCILENMKNVTSDEAAKAIKEACTYKFSSETNNLNINQESGATTQSYSNNSVGVVSIPSNLSACGSINLTRFPIFTGC